MASTYITVDDQRSTGQDFTPQTHSNVHVTVTQTGRISSTSDDAISILYPGFDSEVTIDGYVSSASNTGVFLFLGQLTVGETGRLSGQDGFFSANQTKVTNHGSIEGSRYAINGAKDLEVVNDGTVHGSSYGIYFNARPGSTFLKVENSGTIIGDKAAIYSEGTATNAAIINNGILKSNNANGAAVVLGAGNDIYDGSGGGRAIGVVDLGGGSDTAWGSAADDAFSGGTGDDLLVGGGGTNLLAGGAGGDTLDGSNGMSTADYKNAASSVTVNLSHEELSTGDALGDHFIAIASVWGSSFGDVLVGNDDGNDLRGMGGSDSLVGGEGADALSGGIGDDTLDGGMHNDWIDGGPGADRMDGGDGWDVVSYLNTPASNGGVVIDLVTNENSGAALGDALFNVEVVQGTNADDTISGFNDGANGCEIHGENGDDVIIGKAGGDVLFGDKGDDRLRGGDGRDRLDGGDGQDWFDGGAGADTIDGGGDWDIVSYLSMPAAGGVIVDLSDNTKNDGAAAGDVLSNVEVVQGTNADDTLTSIDRGNGLGAELHGEDGRDRLIGKGGGDRLFGEAGADTLDGGAGADRMGGGSDNDTYVIDSADDVVIEAADGGTDTAIVSLDFRMDRLANVEILKLADGTAAARATGGSGNDHLIGNTNFNILDGGAGADTMEGGTGSDVFMVDNTGDVVIETAGNGVDAVQVSMSYVLAADAEIEFLTGLGSGALRLTGSDHANTITGTAAANVAAGRGGNDVLLGQAGNDTLSGDAGNDRLWGGIGKDVLTGGAGKDVFVFDTRANKKTNLDKIADFSVRDDTIWLDNAVFKKLGKGTELKPGKLNAKFFTLGDHAKDKNDYLIYDNKKGVLYYDADGSGATAAVAIATLKKGLKMTSLDFMVI